MATIRKFLTYQFHTNRIAFCCAVASLLAFAAGHPIKAIIFAGVAAYFGISVFRAGSKGSAATK